MESANIGYYNNLRYGLSVRFGKIKQKWYNFNSSPVGGIQAQESNLIKKENEKLKRNQLFLFASARVNFMAYNALMQGQFRPSLYTLNSSQVNHLIGEAETGIFWQFCRMALTLTLSGRTADFRTPTSNKGHLWGNIYITRFFN